MMHKPSKADVLKVAGEPVGEMREVEDMNNHTFNRRFTIEPEMFDEPQVGTKLYTEAQLLAMYAAGADGMRERAVRKLKRRWKGGYPQEVLDDCIEVICALPITQTNTEGEQG